jgi:DNA-binding SARP family transcriptional activator
VQWKIQLLGGLRAERDGRIITRFRTQKTGGLLAYLAYHAQNHHSREVLVEQFWPDLEAAAPRMSLSVALSSLRRQLEPPGVPAGSVLMTDRFTVQLNPAAVQVDVAEFEAALRRAKSATTLEDRTMWLATAVDRYAGDLLPGYYEEWRLAERERLASAYLRALGELMQACRQAGDLDGALHHAWRAVAADPLQESLHQELLELLLAAGQPATALRQYRELERLLQQELKRSPSPATARLLPEMERFGAPPRTAVQRAIASQGELKGARVAASPSPPSLPSGTVTLLFVDCAVETGGERYREGQFRLPGGMARLLREHGAVEPPDTGSALVGVFSGAGSAVACALAGLQALPPLEPANTGTARFALLTTEIYGGVADYETALERGSWLLAFAKPGQLLCSEQTASLVGPLPDSGACFSRLGTPRLSAGVPSEPVFEIRPAIATHPTALSTAEHRASGSLTDCPSRVSQVARRGSWIAPARTLDSTPDEHARFPNAL